MNMNALARIAPLLLVALWLAWSALAAELDCKECHDDVTIGPAHEDGVKCAECHEDVIDATHEDKGAKPVACVACHEEAAETLERDVHRRLVAAGNDDIPDCKTCHGTHEIEAPADSRNVTEDYCADCHDNVLLVNKYHSLGKEPDATCLECHDEAETFPAKLAGSVHQRHGCADCHAYSAQHLEEHQDDLPFDQVADCYLCHRQEALAHRDSIHGITIAEGVNEAANCWNCHGSHEIPPIHASESPVHPANLAETCAGCHDDPQFADKFAMSVKLPGKMYEDSVHGVLVKQGRMEAANCVLCHGVHDIRNRVQPGSPIHPLAVPQTCGVCHEEITDAYERSIHWARAKRGVKDSPVCNDCHSEHSVQGINVAGQPDGQARRIQQETCLRCHADPVLARRYNLNPNRVASYLDSYHGMAERRGDEKVAMCVDCHGVHEILPQKHPRSLVNVDNVTETCRQCHPGANASFAATYTHEQASPVNRRVIYWVEVVYVWAIWLVVGGMLLHNGLIFGVELRARRRATESAITVPRFTLNEVVQHALLSLSFLVLVVTGFALTYPEAWVFRWLEWLGMSEPVRQWIHRGAGIAMIVLGAYHLGYLAATRRGREVLGALMLRLEDLRGAAANLAFYLGLRRQPPELDDFDYTEKAEYWALIWGTVVMAVTGIILWFPELITRRAAPWIIELSTVIHFYEAVLASLAILIWHGFFVILHPREYPLNFTMVDGRITLEKYAHHHRRSFKRLLLDWARVRAGHLARTAVHSYSGRVLAALEDAGQNPDAVLDGYLAHEPELRDWLQRQLQRL